MLRDANDLLDLIKKAAVEAVDASKPVQVCFGKVTNTSPLKINVEQKMTLGELQLVLCRNVTEFKTTITVDWNTQYALDEHSHEVSGVDDKGDKIDLVTDNKDLSHNHKIVGNKTITVHNGLVIGDEVILLRMQNGQKYIVIDRVVKS